MTLTVEQLYQYFDELAAQDASADELFASSYIRGFIALSASEFGDETQNITSGLVNSVSNKLDEAKTELAPDDRRLVNQYWQSLQKRFFNFQ